MFYWWLLFQKPDQIEVGEDGFRQWDGKSGFHVGKPCSNVFFLSCTFLQFGNQSILNIVIILSSILRMLKTFTNRGCVLMHIGGECRLHVWWSLHLCLLTLSCISDHCPGHGSYGQHCEGLAGEPSQVRPLARRQPVAWGWPGRLGDPHSHRGGLPHLQLQVGALLSFSVFFACWPEKTFHQPEPCFFFVFPFPQASYWHLWQMLLHFHSLWGVQKEEKVTRSCGVLWQIALRWQAKNVADCVFAAPGRTQCLTPRACSMATSGPCTWNTGKKWRTTVTE